MKKLLIILIIALILIAGCKQKATIIINEVDENGKIVESTYIVEDKEYQTMQIETETDAITGSIPLASNKRFIVNKEADYVNKT